MRIGVGRFSSTNSVQSADIPTEPTVATGHYQTHRWPTCFSISPDFRISLLLSYKNKTKQFRKADFILGCAISWRYLLN